jgi:antitoxin (DNA-binding transcriptional repressor) of toxin-antitoxin stability system
MKTVSIDELKRNLASIIDDAAAGERVLITRHRRPVASLTRSGLEDVHVGRRFGRGALRPFLRAATRGAYLDVLAEDRRPRTGRST